jgi:hypothetical protein
MQVPGVQLLLGGNTSAGPALRARFYSGQVNSSYKRYQPTLNYHASNLTALQGHDVEAACWEARRTFLAATAAAWSPAALVTCSSSNGSSDGTRQQQQRVALLAVGCKAGCCQIWRHRMPQRYGSSDGSSGSSGSNEPAAAEYIGSLVTSRGAYVTSMAWVALPATSLGCSSNGSWGVLPGYVVDVAAGDAMLLAVGEGDAHGYIKAFGCCFKIVHALSLLPHTAHTLRHGWMDACTYAWAHTPSTRVGSLCIPGMHACISPFATPTHTPFVVRVPLLTSCRASAVSLLLLALVL